MTKTLKWFPRQELIQNQALSQVKQNKEGFGTDLYKSLISILRQIKAPAPPAGTAFRPFQGYSKFERYDMGGEQKATTRVRWFPYAANSEELRTTGGMHSEMVSIDFMLDKNHWVCGADGVLRDQSGGAPAYVQPGNFQTIFPGDPKENKPEKPCTHCGYCTIVCFALGLPLTMPTTARFKLAGQYKFPLPMGLDYSIASNHSKLQLIERLFLSEPGVPFDSSGTNVYVGLKKMLKRFTSTDNLKEMRPTEWVLECDPEDPDPASGKRRYVVAESDLTGKYLTYEIKTDPSSALPVRNWGDAIAWLDKAFIPMLWAVVSATLEDLPEDLKVT